jgi:undecaprenyl-diphosphatase
MPLFHLFLVAVIQGVTEFLPVSSSGHLILLPNLSGLEDQGQAIDVAVHVGTLLAVIVYFWSDVRDALGGLPRLATGRRDTPGAQLAFLLILSTIPVVALGLVIELTGTDQAMRSMRVIGWTTLVFGILLYWSDQRGARRLRHEDWTVRHALQMGLWQALALIPGTSRSGITITGARLLGYARHDAARLAMLMSIPTILASGLLMGAEVAAAANVPLMRDGAIAAVLAFAAALLALSVMMRLLNSVSFTPYVVYRIFLGLLLLGLAYS